MLATLCLNEMEWLPKLYAQHKNWPGLERWVFVEAADSVYAMTNPSMVTEHGMSMDGTSKFLYDLAERDPRITYIPHGFTGNKDAAKGKIAARQRYMEVAEKEIPNFLVSVDADEFYTYHDQARLIEVMAMNKRHKAFTFPRREIWRPPSRADKPLMELEVAGGFWDIPCCHWWRWEPGLHYGNCHNTPQLADGTPVNNWLLCMHKVINAATPQMIHMGFAASLITRRAKNRYYEDRGEAVDKRRAWYTRSRAAWYGWKDSDPLPDGAKVKPYDGPIPEVFK